MKIYSESTENLAQRVTSELGKVLCRALNNPNLYTLDRHKLMDSEKS